MLYRYSEYLGCVFENVIELEDHIVLENNMPLDMF